ncbi:hypothetical protein Nepgr_000648 [Nepenthes gracilis]|uniref:Ion transport domain-containing protein n=1 Tax=Nepenthes gracilis TaxID=150966 RepID=A0AAD3P6S9_NEPGR|nr:hypothetical protein Nepgr_000648 [Nepenthes gracilis]
MINDDSICYSLDVYSVTSLSTSAEDPWPDNCTHPSFEETSKRSFSRFASMTRWRRRSNRVTDDSQLENSLSSFSILEPAPKEIPPPDDHKKLKRSIIVDPRGTVARRWNIIFFTVSMIALFVDPNFFFLLQARQEMCIELGLTLKIVLTMIRSVVDLFYVIHIFLRFRTAYVAPSSLVIGRGDLVINPWKIALRYLRFGFWIDLTAALPLPQVLIWGILPNLKGSMASNFKICLMLIILVQMLLRSCLAYPLSLWLAKASGIITEKAWVGAAYNLMFYLLASIVSGGCWYILSIERQEECWRSVCKEESSSCMYTYFDCSSIEQPSRVSWIQSSNITNYCNPNNNLYQYGIYIYTITDNISSGGFLNKYFYCLWWGIRNLSSQGQNLAPSIDLSENMFSYLVGFIGLILFAFFVGNMQKYVQSANQRLEEWRIKRTDLEQWMHHRQLPKELRQSVLRYHKYKGVATQGVDEEAILKALPRNLQRQTKQYLCLNLVRQVPLFDKLDDRTLDAI